LKGSIKVGTLRNTFDKTQTETDSSWIMQSIYVTI